MSASFPIPPRNYFELSPFPAAVQLPCQSSLLPRPQTSQPWGGLPRFPVSPHSSLTERPPFLSRLLRSKVNLSTCSLDPLPTPVIHRSHRVRSLSSRNNHLKEQCPLVITLRSFSASSPSEFPSIPRLRVSPLYSHFCPTFPTRGSNQGYW